VVARAIDLQAMVGTGATNTPTGITSASGVNGPINFQPPTWAGVLSFISAVQSDNADFGSLGWAAHPTGIAKLRSTVKVASTDSQMLMETVDSMAGYPVMPTTALAFAGSPATTRIIFGSWSQLLNGYWSGVDITLNPFDSTAFPRGRVVIRAIRDVDLSVRHGEVFAFATNLPN
jgi:Phage capsid family